MAGDGQQDDQVDEYKIMIVGSTAVEKSSLTLRYVVGDFFEHYDLTI